MSHNPPTSAAGPRAALNAYLAQLPLSDEERANLACLPDVDALHQALSWGREPLSEAPAWASQDMRLELLLESGRNGEQARALEVKDARGLLRVQTMPIMRRASMAPEPWSQSLAARLFGGVRALFSGRRGRMKSRFECDPQAPTGRSSWHWTALFRRLLLATLIIGQTIIATYYMTAVLPFHGQHALEIAILIVYAILFGWVSAGFWTAMMGFWTLMLKRDRYSISATAAADTPVSPEARTAILIPICNEDVARVYAGLHATYASVHRAGLLPQFDFYILSDTSDPDIRVSEAEGWLGLCRQLDAFGRIHYRRRRHRTKRKSGNIADWCRRWGSLYQYMVILDADSVMSGDCLKRLVQLMEANPGAGIIQTVPRASGRETLYARIQQFANRVYGPLFTAGLHFWQLGESHYWGHNAIIRVAPFIRHCALGRLPGRGALAGEILSHDFVEAALMRRAGWSVWIAYDLPGSYEEMPPTLIEELGRDRRWCQGNLQNFRLFWTQGLHPAHRAVFMTGVMAYLSAPLWFLFLVLSTALLAVQTLVEPTYFTQPEQLFPSWPEWHPEWARMLFGATATLLFLPKLLSVLLVLAKGAREYGGAARLVGSALIEWVFAALLAPVRMLFHTHFVITSFLGIAVRWQSPPREDAQTLWRDAFRRHGFGTLLGIAWASLVVWLNPDFLWWLLPIVGSLMVAIPLSVLSSRVTLGRAFRAQRLFLIPEESHPPRELRWIKPGVKRHAARAEGYVRAVTEPLTNALMCAIGTPRITAYAALEAGRARIRKLARDGGLKALNVRERNALLSDPVALCGAHGDVWRSVQLPTPQDPCDEAASSKVEHLDRGGSVGQPNYS